MSRVDAGWVVTFVADDESLGNRPNTELERDATRGNHIRSDSECPIAVLAFALLPDPARSQLRQANGHRSRLVHLGPESLGYTRWVGLLFYVESEAARARAKLATAFANFGEWGRKRCRAFETHAVGSATGMAHLTAPRKRVIALSSIGTNPSCGPSARVVTSNAERTSLLAHI